MTSTRFYKFLKLLGLFWDVWRKRNIGAPLLITRDGVILDGNTRALLAQRLNIPSVPVVRIDADVEYVDPGELKIAY